MYYKTKEPYCEVFRFNKRNEWVTIPILKSPKPGKWISINKGPPYGQPSRTYTPTMRCPRCGRRLKMRAIYCSGGGEFAHWELPYHKPRITRKPGPRRRSRRSGRGK